MMLPSCILVPASDTIVFFSFANLETKASSILTYELKPLGSWDPAAKVHMMTHEKQLRDFKTMYDEEAIL